LKQIGLTEIQIGVLSRYIDGHSYERIAEFYNLKKCSVRTIVTRAQQRPLLQRVITERKRRDTTPFI
jgi:DNA-directed RNA polymerase specialized sigma24 family protein